MLQPESEEIQVKGPGVFGFKVHGLQKLIDQAVARIEDQIFLAAAVSVKSPAGQPCLCADL